MADHCKALRDILQYGTPGATYNVGGDCELSNLDLAHRICALLDELYPAANRKSYSQLITLVADRPGHDFRYSIDSSKLRQELGWLPVQSFDDGLRKTVNWFAGRHNQGARLREGRSSS